jgi:hypothetical protein
MSYWLAIKVACLKAGKRTPVRLQRRDAFGQGVQAQEQELVLGSP